jgi:hypothetical protein
VRKSGSRFIDRRLDPHVDESKRKAAKLSEGYFPGFSFLRSCLIRIHGVKNLANSIF